MTILRLDKYLAHAGIGSRSDVRTYIKKGNISVNNTIIKKADYKINSDSDIIKFQNQIIHYSTFVYYILNKPAGYVSATIDNTAPTVLSLIRENTKNLFPVGRLDKDTEGLLLITNDGELSHHLLAPKRHVDKTYYAIIEGIVRENDILTFQKGVVIGDDDLDIAQPAILKILNTSINENRSYIEVTVHEGKFHQVKRMFHAIGKKVIYLKRIQFGPITLPETLSLGKYRTLTEEEIHLLKTCI